MVADALSRPAKTIAGTAWVCAAIADRSPLDLKDMALRQILCPQVEALRSSPGLCMITQKVGDLDLIGNSSTGPFRPLVPRDLQLQLFEHLHGTAHPRRRETCRLISSRYVWKGLSTDVTAWAKACLGCQRANVHSHVQVPPQHIPVPTRHFSHIHVDLVGPLPASKGFTYLFTINDRTSSWAEAIPIAPTTTVDYANALFQGWVSRFRVPAVITCRTQFTSSLWAALCSLLIIQHNQTTAYHPQSAGYASLHSNQQNRAGNHFPLARRQGFLHAPPPFSTPPPLGPLQLPSAVHIRPLGLRPRGLGGAL
jgi:hypothetical protein